MSNFDKITELKKKIYAEIIAPYVSRIYESLNIIQGKGFNVAELFLVMNLLSKSGYIVN
jgi:hypothetical protein